MALQELTPTEYSVYEMIADGGATSSEIAEAQDCSTSVVYDHVGGIREKTDVEIGQNALGEYVVMSVPDQNGPVNATSKRNPSGASKQTITKKANEFFEEIEHWKDRVENYPAPTADGGLKHTEGGLDLTWHITDTHFGDVKENVVRLPDGSEEVNITFNSEIAERRLRTLLAEFMAWADELEAAGYEIDTIHILLGGDMVTNEAIFNKQPWQVDKNIKDQLVQATANFEWIIKKVSERFDSVQVVCQHGNHGEFRVDGSSGQANADDFLYAFLDYNIRKSQFMPEDQFNNITVVKDEHEYYTNYFVRDGQWRGHLRHGQNTRGHVGTSSQQSQWGSWADEHDYDVANYGHHHQYKNEHYNGRRIFMGGTIAPPSEYAESMGEFGKPCGYMYASSDERPVEKVNCYTFN